MENNSIIASITSWKDRIQYLPIAVESIKNQTLKPEKIICYLSHEELSESEIPSTLLNDEMVEVKWVEKNVRSWKKFLPINENPDKYVVLFDDDFIYGERIIEELYDYAIKNNVSGAICFSSEKCNKYGQPWGRYDGKTTNINWVAGCCVMYTPNSFPMEAFDYYEKIMYGRTLQSDECFLMPFIIHNNIPVYTVHDDMNLFYETNKFINGSQNTAMHLKFYTDKIKKSFATNRKNQLIASVIDSLPKEYKTSFIKKFPMFMEFQQTLPIVSLTSHHERVKYVHIAINSILKNSYIPYKIVLVLFKDDIKNISIELQTLINNKSIELIVVDDDLKPHTKYFYTMLKYKENPIITIDDDCEYPCDLIESLMKSYNKFPNCVSARRVHRVKYKQDGTIDLYKTWNFDCKTITTPSLDIMATGVGGVLYPPDILKITKNNISDIKKFITVDDIYLYFLERKTNTKIVYVPNGETKQSQINIKEVNDIALYPINYAGKITKNDEAIIELINKPILKEIENTRKKLVQTDLTWEDFDKKCIDLYYSGNKKDSLLCAFIAREFNTTNNRVCNNVKIILNNIYKNDFDFLN